MYNQLYSSKSTSDISIQLNSAGINATSSTGFYANQQLSARRNVAGKNNTSSLTCCFNSSSLPKNKKAPYGAGL
jgi:hypothetical protein